MTDREIAVLHVDDRSQFRDMTATVFERRYDRFEVMTAANPSEGEIALEDADVDCVVSDYEMPGTDGLEFLEIVREDYPDLPFILFTGKGSEEIASEAISAGVTDYLKKGTGVEQFELLANRVRNAVERTRAEREKELSYRAMDTAREGISLLDPDGTFAYVNRAFADIFAYDREELVGKHWTVLYHEAEATRLGEEIIPAVREVGYWSGETVRVRKDGPRIVTDHRLAAAEGGRMICTARDISDERLRASNELSEQFHLLVDGGDDRGVVVLDHEGYVTQWDASAGRLTGYDVAEVLGTHFSTIFPEDDREAGLPERLLERAAVEGSVSDEGRPVGKEGSRFPADQTVTAIHDDEGTLRGFGIVIREVADRPSAV